MSLRSACCGARGRLWGLVRHQATCVHQHRHTATTDHPFVKTVPSHYSHCSLHPHGAKSNAVRVDCSSSRV